MDVTSPAGRVVRAFSLAANKVQPAASAAQRRSSCNLRSGVMNQIVMVGIATVIAVEKLMPRPEWTVRNFGVAAIVPGIVIVAQTLLRH